MVSINNMARVVAAGNALFRARAEGGRLLERQEGQGASRELPHTCSNRGDRETPCAAIHAAAGVNIRV